VGLGVLGRIKRCILQCLQSVLALNRQRDAQALPEEAVAGVLLEQGTNQNFKLVKTVLVKQRGQLLSLGP
jgi:hypothetical protein